MLNYILFQGEKYRFPQPLLQLLFAVNGWIWFTVECYVWVNPALHTQPLDVSKAGLMTRETFEVSGRKVSLHELRQRVLKKR
jgi:hypothetical protein